MKNLFISGLFLLLFSLSFGQSVPDTETFSLQDVVDVVNPTTDDLQDCFNDAIESYFDLDYGNGSNPIPSNNLYEFRNYGPPAGLLLTLVDSFNVSGQTTDPRNVSFSTDGTKMYVSSTTVTYQYTLSTPWDLGSSSYSSKSNTHNEGVIYGKIISRDGNHLYGSSLADNRFYQWDLSTTWDVSTASTTNDGFYSFTLGDVYTLWDVNSGNRFVHLDYTNTIAYNRTASIAYDISTLSFSASQSVSHITMCFDYNDGTHLFYGEGDVSNVISLYTPSTSFSVILGSFVENQDITVNGSSNMSGFFADYPNFYICDRGNDKVYQYTIDYN